ncbi:hypothetical protein ACIA8O_39430 [Kitasatospora sp. NPDC051853]|uniref:hypothetical protein n=1 Tax=Kitasatospora sp. NPDC051853 TaxID=3364058 RepID=UPI003788545C
MRSSGPGFRLRFGVPDFDAAVHAVLDRLLDRPACRELTAPEPATPPGAAMVVVLHVRDGPGECPDPAPQPQTDPAGLRAAAYREVWPDLLAAMRLWRPVSEDHVAPVSLLAHPVLADLLTPERGRQLLAVPRG